MRSIRNIARFARSILNPRARMEAAFTPFYTENRWGDSESVSGPGSTLTRTSKLRQELPLLLREIRVHTLLDAGCGDFNWMKDTELGVENYIGVDVVPELVERNQRLYGNERRRFILGELTRDKLPQVDVILCRDCLIHFSYKDIAAAIRNFKRSGSTYLLTNTYPLWTRNEDIRTEEFRHINLLLSPFSFPPPISEIEEKYPDEAEAFFGKTLALWKLNTMHK